MMKQPRKIQSQLMETILKLIASSESALETLHAIREFYSIERQLFIVELNELLKVVDEPVPCLVDIVRLKDSNAPTTLLANFNTPEKLKDWKHF